MSILQVSEDRAASKRKNISDTVVCTACYQRMDAYRFDWLKRHPVLNVLICKRCMMKHELPIQRGDDGMDEACRWCALEGDLICCDFCHNVFCNECIRRNLGRKHLTIILNAGPEQKWQCYVCNPEPIRGLITMCQNSLHHADFIGSGLDDDDDDVGGHGGGVVSESVTPKKRKYTKRQPKLVPPEELTYAALVEKKVVEGGEGVVDGGGEKGEKVDDAEKVDDSGGGVVGEGAAVMGESVGVVSESGGVVGEGGGVVGEGRMVGEGGGVVGESGSVVGGAVVGEGGAVVGERGAVVGERGAALGEGGAVVSEEAAAVGDASKASEGEKDFLYIETSDGKVVAMNRSDVISVETPVFKRPKGRPRLSGKTTPSTGSAKKYPQAQEAHKNSPTSLEALASVKLHEKVPLLASGNAWNVVEKLTASIQSMYMLLSSLKDDLIRTEVLCTKEDGVRNPVLRRKRRELAVNFWRAYLAYKKSFVDIETYSHTQQSAVSCDSKVSVNEEEEEEDEALKKTNGFETSGTDNKYESSIFPQ